MTEDPFVFQFAIRLSTYNKALAFVQRPDDPEAAAALRDALAKSFEKEHTRIEHALLVSRTKPKQ